MDVHRRGFCLTRAGRDVVAFACYVKSRSSQEELDAHLASRNPCAPDGKQP